MDMSEIGSMFISGMPNMMYWLGWGLLAVIILAAIVLLYFYTQYKFKIVVFEKRGDGQGGFSIGKLKNDKAKIVKNKRDNIIQWKLLKANKTIQQVDGKYIYGNNTVFLFKASDDLYVPLSIRCNDREAEFDVLDQNSKFWMMNEITKAANDYNVKSGFDAYAPYLIMSGTILFCLILVGVTVWLTFKYAGGGVESINGLTSVIKGIVVSQGAPP